MIDQPQDEYWQCPKCKQDDEFWIDDERNTVTCICGVVIEERIYH